MNTLHPFNIGIFLSRIWTQIKAYFVSLYSHVPFLLPLVIITFFILVIVFLIRRIIVIRSLLREKKIFLELTPPAFTDKSAYTTQQLFSVLHNIGRQLSFTDRLLGRKVLFSFEIVSTRSDGIRYLIKTSPEQADTVKRVIISYLPSVRVREVADYLPQVHDLSHMLFGEFRLKKHFAFPLAKQIALNQHDPVAYITGMMTQLAPDELISLQIVVSPTVCEETSVITHKILRNDDVLKYLHKSSVHGVLKFFIWTIDMLLKIVQEVVWGFIDILFANANKGAQQQASYQPGEKLRPLRVLSTFEQDVVASVQEKIDQPLFETTIRVLVILNDTNKQKQRMQGIASSLAVFSVPKYQSFRQKYIHSAGYIKKLQLFLFRQRALSLVFNKSTSLLSSSEIGGLYHFPFTKTTQTENIAKTHSKKLPAPIFLKQERNKQVIIGQNTYDDRTTPIGLTKEERETHMYVIGRTGSGKTTMLFSMSNHDIENGQGLAFIDPHGDVAEDIVASLPEKRMNDLIYINPIDLKYPIGINLLELTPGLDEDDAELEKEVVAEGVISLFRKVFSSDETVNAHRIEYILRNTIYTAFTIEDATIFTLYDLLNNPPFQQKVIAQLEDEDLKNFWKFELGRAGDFQAVKMVSGVTAKVGRFLFSPTARRILEQKKSTINFDETLNEGKILICNFSQGNLGEDTSRLLGTTILTKIQQAALRRARIPKNKRRPFYLYVDEFQNFATASFIKMLSEGRKYGLSVCIAEQSTSQQQDRSMVNIILANVTTVVCFRSANPVDEELMLTQFAPYVATGDIMNLPRFNFFIKISALESEEPFSGETILIPVEKDDDKFERFIQTSRQNHAIVYKRISAQQKRIVINKEDLRFKEKKNDVDATGEISALPGRKRMRKIVPARRYKKNDKLKQK